MKIKTNKKHQAALLFLLNEEVTPQLFVQKPCLCGHDRDKHRGGSDPGCAAVDCGCRVFVAIRDVRIDDVPADWIRRQAMVWLLHGTGTAYKAIGAAIGLSSARTTELGHGYERRIARRERQASDWNEPWAKRLRAAGAIP